MLKFPRIACPECGQRVATTPLRGGFLLRLRCHNRPREYTGKRLHKREQCAGSSAEIPADPLDLS